MSMAFTCGDRKEEERGGFGGYILYAVTVVDDQRLRQLAHPFAKISAVPIISSLGRQSQGLAQAALLQSVPACLFAGKSVANSFVAPAPAVLLSHSQENNSRRAACVAHSFKTISRELGMALAYSCTALTASWIGASRRCSMTASTLGGSSSTRKTSDPCISRSTARSCDASKGSSSSTASACTGSSWSIAAAVKQMAAHGYPLCTRSCATTNMHARSAASAGTTSA
mmetsp:Transcript_23025/g.60142  ORF Transcript_23025/g.60142 Transcript_23025/m.60142 type:complete len:227 (-) Transcript_23025:281-961(-)|eukprot:CAMPEP_0182947632 /NCGR_PEP_ID=MMETSP0105_2-20130417/58884_1 /TAXON_ID=81532 ORGANISM="Acanthoeca-like sp., Strain 10tr" /NCGR_SAMPLE_ID=MMETSP0105_2 /ASSEMBLY_ACC=CAM_ASM_000205 /LENGTH=226 /DNA_ID=CAMNT_0025087881 /DNA_START=87 /DNA_END=767 /DNA_ORIENTATION=+